MINSVAEGHPDAVTLSAYHDGELRSILQATAVEEHLARCPRCLQTVDELGMIDRELRALPELNPRDRSPADVLAGFATPSLRTSFLRPPRWALTTALVALLTISGVYGVSRLQAPMSTTLNTVSSPLSDQAIRMAAPAPRGLSGAGLLPHDVTSASRSLGSQANSRQDPLAGGRASSATQGRLIARTGEIDLQVEDVQRAFGAVNGIVAAQGGYVAESNNDASIAGQEPSGAMVVLRVPAGHFQATADALAALPHRTLRERFNSTDITESYQNLQAQLQALQVTHDQLMALMRRARSTTDAMAVLDRLTDINTRIDSTQSQITTSANSVLLSTITVVLTPQPRKQIIARHGGPGWQPGREIGNALTNLGLALQALISLAIYAVIYLALPALVVVGVLLVRRRTLRV